jgi:hypothetical protein
MGDGAAGVAVVGGGVVGVAVAIGTDREASGGPAAFVAHPTAVIADRTNEIPGRLRIRQCERFAASMSTVV